MSDDTPPPINNLSLGIKLDAAVDRERLFEDLAEHVVPMIIKGFHCGEMHVSVGDDAVIDGWWTLNWTVAETPAREPPA